MGIRIRTIDDLSCPVIECDHCGKVIEKSGNYEWQPDGDGTIYFTHKGCCRAFENEHGGRSAWWCTEIDCLPVYLLNNLGIRYKDAVAKVERFAYEH